jgi:hypothetical protein
MPHLEPSYLRYIFNGLEKGDLHRDNAAALPEGLTGLYEATFEESKPAREGQKLLETFAIWAILKKEVSAHFVVEILEVPTQEIVDFIATYSNWFTSPESGKYQLYHERLKVYLLQKISENEIAILHDKLIKRLEQALAEQKEDEFEVYGLEFLGAHYKLECISKIETKLTIKTFKKFKKIQFSQITQNRQKLISGGLNWTKQNLYYLAELSTILDKSELYLIVDLLCKINHEQLNILAKINNLVTDYRFNDAIKLVEELPSSEIEEIEIKIKHYLVLLFDALLLRDYKDQKSVINSILISIEDNIPINTDEYRIEQIIPSKTILFVFLKLNLLEIENSTLTNRCYEWFDEEAYLGSDRNKIFDSISDETLDFLTKQLIDKVDINLIDKKIILNLLALNIILSKNKNFLIEEIKFDIEQIDKDFFDTNNKMNELISTENNYNDNLNNSFYNSSHKFKFIIENVNKFNFTTLKKIIETIEENFIKETLILRMFELDVIKIENIEWAFSISPNNTIFYLFNSDLETIKNINCVSTKVELVEICNLILIFKYKENIKTKWVSKYKIIYNLVSEIDKYNSEEFLFDYLDYYILLKLADYSLLHQVEKTIFEKFSSQISNKEFHDWFDYYNIISQFIPFIIFLYDMNKSSYFLLMNTLLNDIDEYEKHEHDELLFFFIDELNNYGRFDLALEILEKIKTMHIKKQTLQQSFAKRIYYFFGINNSIFKKYNLSSKYYREHIILGWSGLKHASLSSIGTNLPDIPLSELNKVFFEQNIVFTLKNPKLLEGISESVLLNEYNNETYFSFNNRGFILPRTLKRMNNLN